MSFFKKIKTVVRCVIFEKETGRMLTSHELIWENKTQAKKGSVIWTTILQSIINQQIYSTTQKSVRSDCLVLFILTMVFQTSGY